MIQDLLKNPLVRIPFMLSLAVGAVGTIAGGFYMTYRLLVWVGTY